MPSNIEFAACRPKPISPNGFNQSAQIPFGAKPEHVRKAMQDFIDFLGFVNTQLNTKKIERLESFLMPANFSSMVGEFMAAAIPKYCSALTRNKYHNGHPDMLPKGHYQPGQAHTNCHRRKGLASGTFRSSRSSGGAWRRFFCPALV